MCRYAYDLFRERHESNSRSVSHPQRFRCAAIAYGYANITRTIPVDKGLAIIWAVSEEAPALVNDSLPGRKDQLYPRKIKQVRYHAQWDVGDEVTEFIDVNDVCLNCAAMPGGVPNFQALKRCGVQSRAQFMQGTGCSMRKVCSHRGKYVAAMKG